jgi:hypothetical protein
MTEISNANWHDEPTDYAQTGKLPRIKSAPPASTMRSLNITAAAADPELLDLPWHIALEEWPARTAWPPSPAGSPATSSGSPT